MIEQLVETWHINNRVTLLLLENLEPEALAITLSKRGGGTPGKQIRHLVDIRKRRLENADKGLVTDIPQITMGDVLNKELLESGVKISADAMEKLIRTSMENDGKVKGFKRGIVAHEAHHRGNIQLTLK